VLASKQLYKDAVLFQSRVSWLLKVEEAQLVILLVAVSALSFLQHSDTIGRTMSL